MKEFNSLEKDGLTESESLYECLYMQWRTSNFSLKRAEIVVKEIFEYAKRYSNINAKRYRVCINYYEKLREWLRGNEWDLFRLLEMALFLINANRYRAER